MQVKAILLPFCGLFKKSFKYLVKFRYYNCLVALNFIGILHTGGTFVICFSTGCNGCIHECVLTSKNCCVFVRKSWRKSTDAFLLNM